jgi:hypothetical protein
VAITTADVSTLVNELSLRFQGDGWGIRSEMTDGGGATVTFFHPLVGELVAVAGPMHDRAELDRVINGLRRSYEREFELVRNGPGPLEHADAVRNVRMTARIAGWDAEDITHVLHLLLSVDALSEEEADWVSKAGPST